MSLSIILTCFNEVPIIFGSYTALTTMMQAARIDYEFIVVDDGSSEAVQRALQAFFPEGRVRLILSSQNEGRGAAVTKGIRTASKDYVCFIDSDLEIPAYTLLVLYYTATVFEPGADMVIADRCYRWNLNLRNLIRNFGSLVVRRITSWALDLGSLDTETGAKLFRRSAVLEFLGEVRDKRWFWDTEVVAEAIRHSQRVVQAPVVVTRRNDKRSSMRVVRDVVNFSRALYAYKRKEKVGRRTAGGVV
ncbi:MAG: glycosyltransferase family 2 protein [Acidobacteria bacterium]|nr:glycosyltransferase family 2 protein [Acidobacteriota bacterium]MBI3655409.1 glycosyltransferase family 2 protein [Acidobacteriota bacterium]